MAAVQRTTVLQSSYHDSLTLVRLSLDLESFEGVERVAAFMGLAENLQLLDEAGFPPPGEPVSGNDLLLAVAADTAESLEKALLEARRLLKSQAPMVSTQAQPRSLRGAISAMPDATLVAVSLPGAYAGRVARAALEAGLNVFLFSDNVPLDEELVLKSALAHSASCAWVPTAGRPTSTGLGSASTTLSTRAQWAVSRPRGRACMFCIAMPRHCVGANSRRGLCTLRDARPEPSGPVGRWLLRARGRAGT